MGKMTAILLCNMSAVRASLLGGWRSQSCPERCVLPHQPVNHDTGRCQLPPQHLHPRVVGPGIVVDPTDANTVYVAASNTDHGNQTTTASVAANPNGTFSLQVPVLGGVTVLNIVAVSPRGATAHVTRTIVPETS